jgi:hypothetical protein
MRQIDISKRTQGWVIDYSVARAKAIEWLGDRYLLAKPINRPSTASPREPTRQLDSATGHFQLRDTADRSPPPSVS